MLPYISSKISSFNGNVNIPGDKSISHRAIMLSSLAIGTTKIFGLLESEDVFATINAFQKMGSKIHKGDNDIWFVTGTGVGGLDQPNDVLDMGNSGTSARLIMGIISGHDINAIITGDKSLRTRPMQRIIEPISQMGAVISSNNGKLPITITGTKNIMPIKYILPIPSAQIKSAVLLAGLTSRGNTVIIENQISRNHTENMLKHFGANISTTKNKHQNIITLKNETTLIAKDFNVPADPSSASFVIAAACITKNSDITLKNICINTTRTGFFKTLIEMGANITFKNKSICGGEQIADINVKYAPLKAVNVPDNRAPSMIDEYPILAIVATFADGKTTMNGIEELRVKESNRLEAIVNGLNKNNIPNEHGTDWLSVYGNKSNIEKNNFGNGIINTNLDHRLAMSFLILGMATNKPIIVDNINSISTSFPNFINLMNSLGAKFKNAK